LKQAPLGHFYDVMTNGFGAMLNYSAQIKPEDRWAIAAYIRALQLSQDARLSDVPEAERSNLLPPQQENTGTTVQPPTTLKRGEKGGPR
jgi:hypothetical protein